MSPIRSLGLLVTLIAIASSPTTARAELLLNGGFDDTTKVFNNWTATGSVFNDPRFSNEGTTSGTLAAVFNAGDSPADGILSQTIATDIGTSYYFSFDFGAFAGSSIEALEATVIGSSTLVDQTVTAIAASDGSTVFSHYIFAFTADNTSTTITFTDRSSIPPASPSGSDGVLDTASVVLVPEPSSIVLGGFAGLIVSAFALRRKVRRPV